MGKPKTQYTVTPCAGRQVIAQQADDDSEPRNDPADRHGFPPAFTKS